MRKWGCPLSLPAEPAAHEVYARAFCRDWTKDVFPLRPVPVFITSRNSAAVIFFSGGAEGREVGFSSSHFASCASRSAFRSFRTPSRPSGLVGFEAAASKL